MAPSTVLQTQPAEVDSIPSKLNISTRPLKSSGSIDAFKHFDSTPAIGREYPESQLAEWINSPNADTLLRDLAITISERGVVFFRNQKGFTLELQKVLAQKLGELTGKPATSGLHIHPVNNAGRGGSINERGEVNTDDQVSVISSEHNKNLGIIQNIYADKFASDGWHSDITFEPVPADYSILTLHTLPPTGGDTLWGSGYDLYDKLSPTWQRFADGLTATYAQPGFLKSANDHGFKLHTAPRGSPENVGEILEAVHPVVRTNPVTGWKSVFAVGHHVGHINDVTKRESEIILNHFLDLLAHNHTIQVRFKWGKNDVAIWDNRSAYHTATFDYKDVRTGNRVVGLGEKPYFDPASKSKAEALRSQ